MIEFLFTAAIEEESNVRILLRFGDTQLFKSLRRNVFTDGVVDIFLVEKNMQPLEFRIVRRHTAVVKRQFFHAVFGHILLGQHDRQLFRPVIAEIEENNHIIRPNQPQRLVVRTDTGDRLDKLVGHTFVIGFLHGGNRIGRFLARAVHQQVVCFLDTLPAFIAVHRIVTADDRSDLAPGNLQMVPQTLDETLTAARIGVAAVHEAVDESLVTDTVLLGDIAQFEQVVQRAVHPSVRQQPHEMHLLAVLLSISKCLHDLRVLQDRVVATGDIDLHKVLIDHAARTDIEVSYLRIAHLAVGQSDILSVGTQLGIGILFLQSHNIFGTGAVNYIVMAVVAFAPAIQNHQQYFIRHTCIILSV